MVAELKALVGTDGVCQELAWARRRGQEVETGSIGCPEDRIFDLASLTKALGTATAYALLLEAKALNLEDPVGRWLPEAPEALARQSLESLLRHRSGLPAWMDLGTGLTGSQARRLRELRHRVLDAPMAYPPDARCLYSDLGFILAAWIAERAGCAVDSVRSRMGWSELYVPGLDGPGDPRAYAPTGIAPDGMKLQGRVHDDNCRQAGGQNTGHAGWFGTVGGVLQAVASWQDLRCGRSSPLPLEGLALTQTANEERSPGFDVPTAGGSTGDGWGTRSFGHLGFTGTAFWIDPDADMAAVLLSNRTWPDGKDRGIMELRQRFFSWAQAT